MLPVEFARRERVFETGEALVVVRVSTGEGEGSVKLVLRGSRSLPARSSRGSERWFSSTVEAGDAERGESRKDMDMVRLLKVRGVEEVSREGGCGCAVVVEQKLCDVTHTPVTKMNRLKASSVWIGI